ncbi:NAD(+) diphosphatase [Ferrovibrio sp.]|uniref:NAD(+) diphosphatase n=1 Tax=Ferrovibrio sp. TaxID=1917215 RepID=UPI00311E4A27
MLSPDPKARPPRPITFTGNPLDRAGNPRRDAGWMAGKRRAADSRFLPMRELKPLVDVTGKPARLAWQDAPWAARYPALPAVFLGLDDSGIAYFALDCDTAPDTADLHSETVKYIDVRSIAPQVSPGEAAILAQARSLVDWHQRHGFCAQCGSPTAMTEGGYSRRCESEACKAQHFPRTDPVVIMLAVRRDAQTGQDMVLLGRQAHFPPGMYSALAGFMEPGETMEEAVRREIMEEAGVATGAVRYIASQPWPFPASLMLGCVAEAADAAITVDKAELEEARWFSRDEIAQMLADSTNMEASPRLSPPISLAHQITRRWIAGA